MTIESVEIALLRAEAEASMRDKCKIGAGTLAAGNNPTKLTWAYGSEIACGFDASKSREMQDGSQTTLTDAMLRLPIATVIIGQNRVQITERNGTDVSEYYAVTGAARRGLTSLVIGLSRITGGSSL